MIKLYATKIIVYKYKDLPGLEITVGNNETAQRPKGDWKKIVRYGSELLQEVCIDKIVSAASEYIIPNKRSKVLHVGSGKQGYQLTIKEKYWDKLYNTFNNLAIQIEDERG